MSTSATSSSRRSFLAVAATALGGTVLPGPTGAVSARCLDAGAEAEESRAEGVPSASFPRQEPVLVERVVAASHGDLETVRELVGERPELAKAQWDWGYGDWESALGAASHTGRREIAELLLRHGARPTLFSAAMLGQLRVVQAFVEAHPGSQGIPGPHGIPLLAHALAGGEEAAPVAAFLRAVGGAGGTPAALLGDGERGRYVGVYRFGPEARDALEVAVGHSGLTLARREGTPRRLIYLGGHVFHPAGARSVRVRFEVVGGGAVALTVHDPEPTVHARRVPAAPG